MYQVKNIEGKDIYIFKSHEQALMPWALIRRKFKEPLNLITLDHHTDTIEAFRDHIFFSLQKHEYDPVDNFLEQYKPIADTLIKGIDFTKDESVQKAIEILDHDEHIDAALRSGIISLATSFNLNSFSSNTIKNRIIEVTSNCAIGCTKRPHDDECEIAHANQVIESEYLNHLLKTANSIAQSIGVISIEDEPYILDIDLDYFHTEKSISPNNTSTFYRLIKNSTAITIALEPECVEEEKLDNSLITSESLLLYLIEHIKLAIKSS